ncbi:putative pectinesterase/pectinesterase inhibitor 45 [Abeliophyllum distichum]|uniref:Pectinesterase/pectinesterase inhibitor 45 n=1 Tax=Abeliophyllum distichum TaxID=126358 RepID=A0ABD1QI22_9LAMI
MKKKVAIAACPKNLKGRYTIYVIAGIYEEIITIDEKKPGVFIYGDGLAAAAIVQGFIDREMTFCNYARPDGHQVVALRVQSDMSAIFDCSIEGPIFGRRAGQKRRGEERGGELEKKMNFF